MRRTGKHRGRGLRTEISKNWQLYLMLTPGILFFLILSYLPMGYLIIAFKDYNIGQGILGSPWVGLANFNRLFHEQLFLTVLKNTVVINLLKLFLCFPGPIFLALCLNEMRPTLFKKLTQSLIYLPHFLSWVVVYGIMIGLFSVNSGLVNKLLEMLGLPSIALLTSPKTYKAFLVISEIWKEIGWGSIIYIATLSGISVELYEAARMDGASKLRQIWHVTLPGLRPTMAVMFILNCGGIVSGSFEQVMSTINSAVYEVGEIIPTYVYTKGLTSFQFSYAAAAGLFQSVIGFALVYSVNKISARLGGETLW